MTGSHERIACRDPISRDGDDDRFSFHPGVGLIAAGAVVVNWEAVSAFIHLSQIKSGLGL